MDSYHRNQFYWRLDVLVLFSLGLVLLDSLQHGLRQIAAKLPQLAPVSAFATVGLLVALLGYHEYRIHWFRVNAVGQEYFLTKDAEALRPWLEQYGQTHKQFSLATVSPELNYLCAYWTDADLLLPSGFPYHSLQSNKSIRQQTLDLLHLYRVTSEAWTTFAEPKDISFHNHWRVSRPEAVGHSYLYYLYHRGFTLNNEQVHWRRDEIRKIANRLEETRPESPKQPDVILIDEVSRSIGAPDLTAYRRAFCRGSIEAWVLDDSSLFATSP